MRIVCFIACAAFAVSTASFGQSTTWFKVSSSDNFVTNINPGSIKRLPNGERTAWFERLYPHPTDNVKRRIAKLRYRCDEEMSAVETGTTFDLSGRAISSFTNQPYQIEWESIAPGSVGEAQMKVVCNWPV
ncbi:surface-adhesin E family protein [Sphingobium yanoikuyae]|uniref:surface-adhesin E family protein n=1 Tax=Sphingobium yanoikuyae TaxID=13690 RepID=UPI003F08193B